MTYWRMQLHPGDSARAMRYAVESLGAGFIGLDFESEPGDLRLVAREALPAKQRDYWDFAHGMQPADRVLIVVHHFPFALVTVGGDYNYIRAPEPELGVWFRHFRRIDRRETRFFGDRMTNARDWEKLTMTDTIAILRDPTSKSYRLIRDWSGDEVRDAEGALTSRD